MLPSSPMVEGVSELCPVRCDGHHKLFGCLVSQARKVLHYSRAMAPRSAAMVRRSRAASGAAGGCVGSSPAHTGRHAGDSRRHDDQARGHDATGPGGGRAEQDAGDPTKIVKAGAKLVGCVSEA
jgi:hypothetical protein